MGNSSKKQSRASSWGYRVLVGLGFILVLALGGAFVLYLSLPMVSQHYGEQYLSRKLDTTVQVKVRSITPWQTLIDHFETGEMAPGVKASLSGIEIRYQPEHLISQRQLDAVRLEEGILEIALDSLLSRPAAEADLPAGAPMPGLPTPWPVRRWDFNPLTVIPRYQGQEWRARVRGIGLEEDSRVEQALHISVPDWNLESDFLAHLDLNDRTWNLNWDSEVGSPDRFLATVQQLPRVPALPDNLTYSLESLRWEGQTRGRSAEWESLSSFFDTGPGKLEWEGGSFNFEGLAGAALADAPSLEATFGRLHIRVQSLRIESVLETRAFAIELHKTRNRKLLAQVGPFGMQHSASSLEGEFSGEADLTPEGIPVGLKLDLKGHAFHLKEGGVDLSGKGTTALSLVNGEAEAPLRGRLEWELDNLAGVWEPLFIDSLNARGTVRELALPLSSVVSLGNEWENLLEMDWAAKLEQEFRGEVLVEAKELSVPGQGSVASLEISVARESLEEKKSPFQLSMKSGAASYRGFSTQSLRLEGEGSRGSGQVNLTLEKPSGGRMKATLNYEQATPKRYTWKGEIPPVSLSNEGWLGSLVPAISGSQLKGRIGLSGDGFLELPSTWNGRGSAVLEGVEFDWPDQALTLSGLNARLKLSGFNPITLPEYQLIKADRLKKGDLEANNLRVRVAVKENGVIQVGEFQGSLFQGTVRADPFEIDPQTYAFQVKLRLESLDLEKVMVLAKDFPGTLQGMVDGVLRVGWDGKEISFGEGYLEMVPGTEGRLELNLDQQDESPTAEPYAFLKNLAQQQTAVESLRVVRLESARFDLFNPDNPQSPNQLRLKGVSLSLKPQAPVDITLNLREDVEESIRQLIQVFLSAR